MSVVQQRLEPEVFRLPVTRIREGYYSDQYFNLTRELLIAEDRRPRVLMQVFQKEESVFGGVDEAIAVLKQCAGRHRPDGTWEDGWDALSVHASGASVFEYLGDPAVQTEASGASVVRRVGS